MENKIHLNSLNPGYKLHWYRIEKVLGQGGFGITYLAYNFNLDRMTAIKEYLPMDLVVREEDFSLHPLSDEHNKQFHWGLDRFLKEARTLAKFEHPNIVRVLDVFEDNHTAYMVMSYEEGESLQDILTRRKTLKEKEIYNFLIPILDGLEKVHLMGFIHRDVKPANIYLRVDGSPVLLDFGSARHALLEQPKTMTSLFSPGYAPFEQYQSRSDAQGPWTDIYGLGATLYRAVTGVAPIDAIDRSSVIMKDGQEGRDRYISALEIGQGNYSEQLLLAIDHALQFKEADRPQTISQWRKEFSVTETASTETTAVSEPRNEKSSAEVETASNIIKQKSLWSLLVAGKSVPLAWIIPSIVVVLILGAYFILSASNKNREDYISKEIHGPKANHLFSDSIDIQNLTSPEQSNTNVENKQPPHINIRDQINQISGEFVNLPEGNFIMGCSEGDSECAYDEKPAHLVNIKPFRIGKYEVTFNQYDEFANATGKNLPSDEGWGRGNRPVINVTWDDAQDFASWLTQQTGIRYRLPTEAEWEYAARAGSKTKYWWGDGASHDLVNNGKDECCSGLAEGKDQWINTAPVGSFPASVFGLYDMVGNVSEWVQDCWNDSYTGAPNEGSAWLAEKCEKRIFRGGSWSDTSSDMRSSARYWFNHDYRYDYIGFRLVQEIAQPIN